MIECNTPVLLSRKCCDLVLPEFSPHVSDLAPGRGALRPARSWLHSDANSLSLNGSWRFRLSPTASAAEDFAADGFDDHGWDSIPVPACPRSPGG